MVTLLAFIGAALTEIAGCFSFWVWIKLSKPIYWLIPGLVSLIIFAYLLTLVDSDVAGRAYAAYGAVYIISSILWMWGVEGAVPDRFDIIGAFVCIIGAAIIFCAPRS